MRVVADVGNTRVIGTVLKFNPLTTVVKLDPVTMMKTLRGWFMEHGVSMTEYRNMLKTLGITRDGVTKRHNLKHRVSRCEI